MGKLFDAFGALTFANEAEVSKNFVQPLLKDFLGYEPCEVLPEMIYPARDIYSGVNFNKNGSKGLIHRPDFVVCLDGDIEQPKFIIDSKGPHEKIDSHLGQLRSYALSVGVNFLMMTNGIELKVYDVNVLLFHSNDITSLQIGLDSLFSILGKDNHSIKSALEILKESKQNELLLNSNGNLNSELQRKKVLLADFQSYLANMVEDNKEWHRPSLHFQALDNLELSKIDPNALLRFQLCDLSDQREKNQIGLHSIEHDRNIKIKVIVGDTGTGKSCLLKFLSFQSASRCMTWRDLRIPIFVKLSEAGFQYKLEDLIIMSLNRKGYDCKSIYDLPKKNEFVFYLDAFDEISEQFHAEIANAIENIATKFECYVTTRPNVIPKLKPSVIYELLPISEWQAKEIIQSHLDDRYYEFHRKLENTNLNAEAGNILLLLCLISVFKESGTLPNNTNNLIASIVKRVENWQNSKIYQLDLLSWDNVKYFLSLIAYKIIESQQTIITMEKVEPIILEGIIALEQLRKITLGQSITKVINALKATGLVLSNSNSIYFWHRLFLNHFAAIALKTYYSSDETIIKTKIKKEYWQKPLLHLASTMDDVTPLLANHKEDIWFAAQCLSENSKCDETVLKEIVERLLMISKSEIPELRIRASHFIVKIACDYVLDILYQAIEQDWSTDLKMYALSTVAKTKSDRAYTLIKKYLKWNEGSFFSGRSSQAHICRALYYFEENEHLQIIENWKEFSDYRMSLECERIFIDLYNQKKLTDNIINQLRSWFEEMITISIAPEDKANAIANILSLVPDENFSLKILDLCLKSKKHNLYSTAQKLMMGTKSVYFMVELKNRLLEKSELNDFFIFMLREVACRRDVTMPLDFYLQLSTSPNTSIAAAAIEAIGRFEFEISKQTLEYHLYSDKPQLQSAALRALTENGEIINLVRDNRFPEHFYPPTAHSLLNAVRRYYLLDAIYLLDSILNHIKKYKIELVEYNITIELARTYFYIGEYEKYKEIVGWYFDGNKLKEASDFIHNHLMNNIKYFDRDTAFKIAIGYFNFYFPFHLEESGGYEMEVFLKATEELGSYELVEYIKNIVEYLLKNEDDHKNSDFYLERPMRALASLVTFSDEQWILGTIESMKNDEGFQFPELRRAVECLALVGTKKSLPYLQKISEQFRDKEAIVDICQLAFERICLRESIYNEGDILSYSV